MERLEVSLILPVYNEKENVRPAVDALLPLLQASCAAFEIIVVDDGSRDGGADGLAGLNDERVRLASHEVNLGYGAALKTGIDRSRFPWIAIVDADSTYPLAELPRLLAACAGADMAVGARTGRVRRIPLLRRPAKWAINRLASYITRRRIPDVNSGFRVFRKELATQFWGLLPDGFSFTTTLTVSALMSRRRIAWISVDYDKRRGRSKIRPLHDTYQFVLLILRLATLFDPLRIFMPAFFLAVLLTLASLLRDLLTLNIGDTTVTLFLFSIQLLMLGLLADLINRRGPWQKP